ncbi:MAG: hypothetical protein ACT4OZ_16590 [Gemmatimonadota bacterium]
MTKRVALFLVAGTISAAACGGESTGPAVLAIDGRWTFNETFADTPNRISCTNTASITITQTGDRFTGTNVQTGTCTDPMGTFDNSGTFQLREGRVAGTTITWRDDSDPACNYTGAITGSPPDRMSGTLRCAGSGLNLIGTWQAMR